MIFTVRNSVPVDRRSSAREYVLVPHEWDDWFKFDTTFTLWRCDAGSDPSLIGQLKIGQAGLIGGGKPANPGKTRSPALLRDFDKLGPSLFSLGQDASYYENLMREDRLEGSKTLEALNDVAQTAELFAKYRNEPVMADSLLRFVDPSTVQGQFRRLANGGAKLASYSFQYRGWVNPQSGGRAPTFTFDVSPNSLPPTNVHVIIGRNGVGKSHVLHNMVPSYLRSDTPDETIGLFSFKAAPNDNVIRSGQFAGMVAVNFSAFDDMEPLDVFERYKKNSRFSYVGLKTSGGSGHTTPDAEAGIGRQMASLKSSEALGAEYARAAQTISANEQAVERWRSALSVLDSDPVFETVQAYDMTKDFLLAQDPEQAQEGLKSLAAPPFWKNLSSGHKLVLLTIARLVETVQEQTLVLIDEPENHLHPPLLGSFLRALSQLLTEQNGVAIVATHSPVILQEVPRTCVSLVRKSGMVFIVERPRDETFGESLGILTREVFGLEVARSGFTKMLTDVAGDTESYEAAVDRFGGQLGAEARAILRGLTAINQAEPE